VECPIELAVTEAIETVALDATTGGRQWSYAGQLGKGVVVAQTTGVGPGNQELGGAQRTDALRASNSGARAATSFPIWCS